MATLGLHLDHPLAPAEHPEIAGALGALLERPCFASLRRVAVQDRAGDPRHQPKDRAAIAAGLTAPGATAVALDCGGEVRVASARICAGRPVRAGGDPRPLLVSTVVVPVGRADAAAVTEVAVEVSDVIDAFAALAAALGAVAGYIAVEPDHDRALAAALAQAPCRDEVRDHYRRGQERRAHAWYDRDLDVRISGPEWGILLGPRHLEVVTPDPSCFPIVRDAGAAKLALLSEDPADALAPSFIRRLDAARRALGPLLMDVSSVPVL